MKKQPFKQQFKIGVAEVLGRLSGEIAAKAVLHALRKKKTIGAPKPVTKPQLGYNNYALINRNLQKKLDEGVSPEDEREIFKQMVHNYKRMEELGYLKGE